MGGRVRPSNPYDTSDPSQKDRKSQEKTHPTPNSEQPTHHHTKTTRNSEPPKNRYHTLPLIRKPNLESREKRPDIAHREGSRGVPVPGVPLQDGVVVRVQ